MLRALTRFGIYPAAVCGHSYGELVALHAAGWISQEDLWRLSRQRGRLMDEAGRAAGDAGSMLAVKAPLQEIASLVKSLQSDVVLANRNSLDQGVLSGTSDQDSGRGGGLPPTGLEGRPVAGGRCFSQPFSGRRPSAICQKC